MSQNYTPEFKKKIVRLHEEEGRSYKSITAEYGVSKAAISAWCKQFREECQASPQAKEDYDSMKENLRLKRENEELGLMSIVRPKKPEYRQGKPHKVFENRLKQEFSADAVNKKWCTDFTYLFLSGHEVRYNCTIIDLYDRSVVSSITDRYITSDLAIRTLQKALKPQTAVTGELILHSAQGTQYMPKAFVEFCESVHVTQSMSKAGYPYDNAPMERYFNTLKNECINLYQFRTEESLYQTEEEFAYVTYNHVRPHSYNDYRTPYQMRTADQSRAGCLIKVNQATIQ